LHLRISAQSKFRLRVSISFYEKFFRKIDDGRYQHLCKVDFHGVHISTGKGHNKSESKKDASAFAIKLVAPNIYKALLSEHASSTAHQ
jgi:hypothetical protein